MKVKFEVCTSEDGYESVEIQQNAFKNNERLLAIQQYIADMKVKFSKGSTDEFRNGQMAMLRDVDDAFNKIVGARK